MKSMSCLVVQLLLLGMSSWVAAADDLSQVRQQYVDSINKSNLDALAALFHDDAYYLAATNPFLIEGKEGIRTFFKSLFDTYPNREFAIRQFWTKTYGNMIVENGYFHFLGRDRTGRALNLYGRYTTCYIKQAGKLLIVNVHASALPTPM